MRALVGLVVVAAMGCVACGGSDQASKDETPPTAVGEQPKAPQAVEASKVRGPNSLYLASAKDLPTCDANHKSMLAYLVAEKEFWACDGAGWVAVSISTPTPRPTPTVSVPEAKVLVRVNWCEGPTNMRQGPGAVDSKTCAVTGGTVIATPQGETFEFTENTFDAAIVNLSCPKERVGNTVTCWFGSSISNGTYLFSYGEGSVPVTSFRRGSLSRSGNAISFVWRD